MAHHTRRGRRGNHPDRNDHLGGYRIRKHQNSKYQDGSHQNSECQNGQFWNNRNQPGAWANRGHWNRGRDGWDHNQHHNHDQANNTNNKNRDRPNSGQNGHNNSPQPLLTQCLLEILRTENFETALKALASITAVLLNLAVVKLQTTDKSAWEIARKLDIPLRASIQLRELSQTLIDGALGPDPAGNILMLDADAYATLFTERNQNSNALFNEPILVAWELMANQLSGT